MLSLRKAQIERTVQDEMARFHDIESRLQQLDGHDHLPIPDVVLKSVPAQDYLSLREVVPGMESVRRLVETIVTTVPAVIGKHMLGTIAVVIHAPMYDPEAMDVEVCYLLTGNVLHAVTVSEDRILTPHPLPAIDMMATIVQVGRVDDSHIRSYDALAHWLETNQYQIVGPGRELLRQLPLPGKEEEAVIEIQLPVRKHEHFARFL